MLIVQKYGGATVATPEKIKTIARQIHELHKNGNQIVAVVSAMGSTTNELIRLANSVAKKPSRREMDMLLTTGERVSMSLLSMALNELGTPAISFTGSQAGIFTDDSHVNAKIIDVKAFRVDEALKAGKVVVLAGFQGVSPKTKEITTLGRGGSDTTAVAMAAYLKADVCEILKDVPGILSADPKLVKDAKPISEIHYDELVDMTFSGAKVLHYRSAEMARDKKVKLYIGPAEKKDKSGTWVVDGKNKKSESKVLSINSYKEVVPFEVDAANAEKAYQILADEFNKNEIAEPHVLKMEKAKNGFKFYLTGPDEIIELLKDCNNVCKSEGLCSVTATIRKNSNELAKKLSKEISFQQMWQSENSITFLVEKDQRTDVIHLLHGYAVPLCKDTRQN